MSLSAHALPRTPQTGWIRAAVGLLVVCLLLGALPLRAWAGSAAVGGVFGPPGANGQAAPPCHGTVQEPASPAGTETSGDSASTPTAPASSLSALSCDCCLACSPAATGGGAAWSALPEGSSAPAAGALPEPLQAQRDGVFRPPRG
jgi:hypothetical protein